jgi:hypothetical protein
MLFRIALALFKLNEKAILRAKDFADIYFIVNTMAHNVDDCNKLFEVSAASYLYLQNSISLHDTEPL